MIEVVCKTGKFQDGYKVKEWVRNMLDKGYKLIEFSSDQKYLHTNQYWYAKVKKERE